MNCNFLSRYYCFRRCEELDCTNVMDGRHRQRRHIAEVRYDRPTFVEAGAAVRRRHRKESPAMMKGCVSSLMRMMLHLPNACNTVVGSDVADCYLGGAGTTIVPSMQKKWHHRHGHKQQLRDVGGKDNFSSIKSSRRHRSCCCSEASSLQRLLQHGVPWGTTS